MSDGRVYGTETANDACDTLGCARDESGEAVFKAVTVCLCRVIRIFAGLDRNQHKPEADTPEPGRKLRRWLLNVIVCYVWRDFI